MNKKTKAYLVYLIPILFLTAYFFVIKTSTPVVKEYTVTEIVSKIKNDEVTEVTTQGSYITGKLNDKDKTEFKAYLPSEFRINFYDNYLKAKVDNNTIKYNGKAEPTKPFYLEILPTLIVLIGLGVLWFLFMRQAQGGGKVMNFGKSKARLHKDKKNEILLDWMKKYKVYEVNSNYISRFDHTRKINSREVYVTNYEKEKIREKTIIVFDNYEKS